MSWKISIYEEPGVLLMVKTAANEPSPKEQAENHLKGGLEQDRNVLALVENVDNPDESFIVPQEAVPGATFDELTETVQQMLGEREIFACVRLMDAALRGPHAENPEVWMLAASVFELVRFHSMAAPLLERAQPEFDGLRKAAVQIRLARALRRSGTRTDVSDLVKEGMACEELLPILKVEGLLLLAMSQQRDDALETLDNLLDEGEEHLGDHRLVSEALELHADLLSDSDATKAQQFYLAAGKMLLRLQDPYFFSLNERLVVHHLKHREMETALALSEEMFQLLKQTGGPPMAHIPFLVFASWIHEQLKDTDRSSYARKAALDIDPDEVARVEANLQRTLTAVQAS